MVFERLKAIALLLMIALLVESEPVVPPAPICSVPALMVVDPEYELFPERVTSPFPLFVRLPVPLMFPLKVPVVD